MRFENQQLVNQDRRILQRVTDNRERSMVYGDVEPAWGYRSMVYNSRVSSLRSPPIYSLSSQS